MVRSTSGHCVAPYALVITVRSGTVIASGADRARRVTEAPTMLLTERLRLAVDMLGWSHAQLIDFVRTQSEPGGMLTLSSPLPASLDIELEARRSAGGAVDVRALSTPEVTPAGDAGTFVARAITRRSQALRDVATSVLERPGIHAADLAGAQGMHVSVIERIVRGRAVRVDGDVVRLDALVDFVGEVRTTRTEPGMTGALWPCTQHHDLGDASLYEWPNNVLSTRTVVLEGGTIARDGDGVVARYLPAERSRCVRLADEAAARLDGVQVGMKSEGDAPFLPFFCTASPDTAGPPATLDEAWVRALFGGTICPLDPVRVQPFAESSPFFADAVEGDPEREARFRALLRFFDENDLTHATGIEIGFFEYAPARPIPAADHAAGFESRGSRLPRLIVGLTAAGSVVGVFSHAVWT